VISGCGLLTYNYWSGLTDANAKQSTERVVNKAKPVSENKTETKTTKEDVERLEKNISDIENNSDVEKSAILEKSVNRQDENIGNRKKNINTTSLQQSTTGRQQDDRLMSQQRVINHSDFLVSTTNIRNDKNVILPVVRNTTSGLTLDRQNANLPEMKFLNSETIFIDFSRSIPAIFLKKVSPEVDLKPMALNGLRISAQSGLVSSIYDVGLGGEIRRDSNNIVSLSQERLRKPTFGVQLEKVYKSGFKLTTGVNYLNQGYAEVLIDTTIVEKIGVTTFEEPSQLEEGVISQVSTTSFERELSIHKIVNTKNLNTIQIPVMIGWEKKKGMMDYSISVGAGINYLFDAPKFDDDLSIFETGFGLSGLTDIQIGYNLNDKFRVFGSAIAGYSFTNWVNIEFRDVLDSTNNHYGLRAGISYNL